MSPLHPAAVVVLAAGEGTRMRSGTPKVLHTIGGRTLIWHALAAACAVNPEHLAVVVRHGRDRVAEHVAQTVPEAVIAESSGVDRPDIAQYDIASDGRLLAAVEDPTSRRSRTVLVQNWPALGSER